MVSDEFLAQTLNSRQLLSLLFILESKRKGTRVSSDSFRNAPPAEWEDFLSTFAVRFANLAETLRFEVIEAHIMSVEDLDIYHNETLKSALDQDRPLLDSLTKALDKDPRFQT